MRGARGSKAPTLAQGGGARKRAAAPLTHLDETGAARMVDVGAKPVTSRHAVARGRVRLSGRTLELLSSGRLVKGDAVAVARLAGLQAAKRTSDWIPLCHAIPLDHVHVDVRLDRAGGAAEVEARAAARWTTGVEMEALVAVAAACLALVDMVKSVERGATIERIELLEKAGGRSGTWRRPR